jgi:hypothetical protein
VKTIDILNVYIKFGTKLFHLTRKKRGNLKHVIGKVKKNMNLNDLRMSP